METESTRPPNIASRESRAILRLHVYPQEVVFVFISKTCVIPSPHPRTHMHIDLVVPIRHLWFIFKVLPRGVLQQHALVGGNDKKWGENGKME